MRYFLSITLFFLSFVVLLPSCAPRYKTNFEMLAKEKRKKSRKSYSPKKKKKEKYLSRRKGRMDKAMPDPFGSKRGFKIKNTRNSTGIHHKPKQRHYVANKKVYTGTKRTKRHLRKGSRKMGKEDRRLGESKKRTNRDRKKNLRRRR